MIAVFSKNKITIAVLKDLDKEDLKELGITALGDRKRLQQLISSLKPTESVSEKESLFRIRMSTLVVPNQESSDSFLEFDLSISEEHGVVRIEKEVDANPTENTQDVRLEMVSHKNVDIIYEFLSTIDLLHFCF